MRRPSRAATWVVAVTGTVTALAGTVPPATGAGEGAGGYGQAWNILPPGQSGTVTATDLATVLTGGPDRTAVDGKNAPENFADQLEMYDALTRKRPSALTRADLDTLYKPEGFTPQKVVRQATPKQGVRIQWDQYGVPYIHGDTYTDTMFGAGWAGTQDRMFLMDVLRHAGRARLAEFAGATPDNLEMDRTQLRTAFYTEKEAQTQMARAAKRYGARGQKVLHGADAFIAGINAAQEQMCPHGNVLAPSCPAEYAGLQKTPQPWTRADVVYVASLVGGIFGKGGGQEYANAVWLQRLTNRFGPAKGRRIYDDL